MCAASCTSYLPEAGDLLSPVARAARQPAEAKAGTACAVLGSGAVKGCCGAAGGDTQLRLDVNRRGKGMYHISAYFGSF